MSVRDYQPVIGLEVHCQLDTASKMFTGCPFHFGAEPNTQVDAYTLGLPGTLPVPNARAVEFAVRVALAARCEIQRVSRWARKHYFYPDLPKGYQITQNDHPYARGGGLEVPGPKGAEGDTTYVRLIRIHMEEDAGKNTHLHGERDSLVDYNRAGAPLVEIVSEPDIRSAAEAARYMKELRAIVRYLGVSDANMEQGSLRCDANVSIGPAGGPLGTRCEIKNLNSFKFLELAIRAEIRRQRDLLARGLPVQQCTLSYDTARDETRIMRLKEAAADYRYFPEPDMPPLVIEPELIERVQEDMPELPAARRARYRGLGLSAYDAGVLTADAGLARYFDAALTCAKEHGQREGEDLVTAKKLCNWITGELLRRVNEDERGDVRLEPGRAPVEPAWSAELVALVEGGVISARAGKEVLGKSYAERRAPGEIVERDGYRQVSDTGELSALIEGILDRSEKQVAQYLGGKTKLLGFFVGQVMKATRGQANPKVVRPLLLAALKARA